MNDLSTASRTDLHERKADVSAKLGRAEAEIEAIKSEMATRLSGFQAEAQSMRSQLGQIESELSRREARDAIEPNISDHALLRYIERRSGVDMDALRAELMTPALINAVKAGATGLKGPLGTFVIKGSTVVTFLSADMRPKRKTQRGLYAEAEIDDGTDEI